MASLTWEQVSAWRMEQHHLTNRATRQEMFKVVSRLGNVQAQVMSAAELAIGARVNDISPVDVQNALWVDRTLVKTWSFRGTLHLLTAQDLPLYTGMMSTFKHYMSQSWLTYFGVTREEMEAIFTGIQAALSEKGITREQLANIIAEQTGNPKVRESMLSGWGTLLKPAAFQGHLCFGISEGKNITFVSPAKWLGAWERLHPDDAIPEVLRRHFATFGPTTAPELARWIALASSTTKKLLKSMGEDIEEVNIEGHKAWVLASTMEQIKAVQPTPLVRLLPLFDTYTIFIMPHVQYLMDISQKGKVYRPQGWISAVVVVNGRIEGVWKLDKKRGKSIANIEMFAPPSSAVKQGIEAELERMGKFLNTEIALVI